MVKITAAQYKEVCNTLLKAVGAEEDEIRIIADATLFASLHGHDSHGIGHLPMYVQGYRGQGATFKGVQRGAKISVEKETPATVVINGNWAAGHKVSLEATEIVINKAKTTGIAAATVYNSVHNGALSYYVNKIVENDMIGMFFTCAASITPPHGGTERMLGTNPMSMGFPSRNELPIIFDMATSSATHVGLNALMRAGGAIAPGLLLDDYGEPTTDARAFSRGGAGQEAHGSMANMASNHKGYAIQLAVEVLGGILPALITGKEVSAIGRFHNPALIIAINVSFFQDLDAFKDKMDARIRQLKSSKKKPGVNEIFMPGEQGFKKSIKNLKDGMSIDDAYWNELTKLANELNVRLPDIQTVSV